LFDIAAWFAGLGVILALGFVTWLISLPLKRASIVDPVWSLLFIAAGFTYAATTGAPGGDRRTLVLFMVTAWGVRLSAYLTWRAWGEPEDKRYAAMRKKQDPGFAWKSLFTVFGLQGLLAWVVSLPLLAGVDGSGGLGALDWVGAAVWLAGMVFEAGGDWQLTRFLANPDNKGKVLRSGLWRYTRHPNYFGNFTIWWGIFLVALSSGGWWSAIGPAVMSYLLLKVSGVAMLERTIDETRPKYADYITTTNAFFPGPVKDS